MDDDDDDDEENDGWKILKPDIILFETTIGSLDKPLPHPILDDPSKMMRIIANPLYDKLTLSRAAHIQNHISPNSRRSSTKLSRFKEKKTMTPFKSEDIEQTIITPLPNSSEISDSRPQSKYSSKRHVSPPFRLPTPASSTRKSSRNFSSTTQSRANTARSTTTQSIQSALIDSTPNIKKPLADGTTRYVNSRHGFEVQRYSSSNWLATDIFTKDACQAHEKTFREMLDKKRQYERLSRSIYSSEYYKKRWHELLESYHQGYLTHEEWAKQNYQLLCLRTLYTQAKQREQRDIDLDAQDIRRTRAKSAYHQWKEAKTEENSEYQNSHLNTSHSQPTTEGVSFLSNNSLSIPMSTTIDESNTTLVDTNHRMSISTSVDSDVQRTSIYHPTNTSKKISATEKALYMLDEQRWSLQAMLKRVVGLAEPLPPPPKVIRRKQSPVTNTSIDSGFESVS